jgi:hypothetical protein
VAILGPQPLNTDADYDLGPLTDSAGQVPPFTGSEPLVALLWRPDVTRATAPLRTLTPPAWLDPAAGTIRLSVNAADLGAIPPGDYRLQALVSRDDRPLGTLYATLRLADAPLASLPAAAPGLSPAAVERLLVRPAAHLLAAAGMDPATTDGSHPDVQPALAAALRQAGYPTALVERVSPGELESVPPSAHDGVLLLGRINLLEAVLDRLQAKFSVMIGADSLQARQMADGVEKTITRLRTLYETKYGSLAASTVVVPIGSDYSRSYPEISSWPYTPPGF